jgi:hypothetical protein
MPAVTAVLSSAPSSEAEVLLGRLERIASPGALSLLPTRSWIEAELRRGGRDGWWGRLARRGAILERVRARLDAVRLPSVTATGDEIRRRHIRKAAPSATCPACGGTGLGPCPACGGTGRTPDDLYPCPRCQGTCAGTCPCCEIIELPLPRRLREGMIVAGRRRSAGRPYLARLRLPARTRPIAPLLLILLGLVGMYIGISWLAGVLSALLGDATAVARAGLVNSVAVAACGWAVAAWVVGELRRPSRRRPGAWRAYSRLSWWLLQLACLALMAGILVRVLEQTGDTLYEGLAPESVAGVLRQLGAAALVVCGLLAIRSATVSSWFGVTRPLSARVRWLMTSPWERAAGALASRRGKVAAGALVAATALVVLTVTKGRPYAIWVGGHTARRMTNYDMAVNRFRYLVKSGHPKLAAPARARELEARYQRTLGLVERHEPRDDSDASVDRAITLNEDIGELVEARKELAAPVQPRVPELVGLAAEVFLDWERWKLAHDLFIILLKQFPEHEYTRNLAMRAEWRLAAIESVSSPVEVPSMPRNVAYRYPWSDQWEAEHEMLKAADGNRLLVIAAKLVHIGRSRKEIVADRFSIKGDKQGTYRSHGFQFDELNTVDSEGGPIPVRMKSLKPARQFKGVSVGPDPCRAQMVMEVPDDALGLELYLDAQKIADIE